MIFPDRIEVNPFRLKLPYSSIIDIEKIDAENKISVDRLVALGFLTGPGAIAGLFWKKKHVYTVIHYNDYADNEKMVVVH